MTHSTIECRMKKTIARETYALTIGRDHSDPL
jgi:hypothetical protein